MSKWFGKSAATSAALASIVSTLSVVGGLTGIAYAETLQSNNYRFEESVLGGGGLVQSASPNYQTDGSVLGDTAVGESASANYQFTAGNKTTPDPTLTFGITSGNVNFGSFSPSSTATATATFSVINYTSYGYSVQITGTAPSNGAHTITPMTITGPASTGIEQFGMNLVANTTPNVGQNITYGPFGKNASPGSNYATTNNFRFGDGEQIASGSSSSGAATYTISYIINVSGLTPGGQYSGKQTIICTGTF